METLIDISRLCQIQRRAQIRAELQKADIPSSPQLLGSGDGHIEDIGALAGKCDFLACLRRAERYWSVQLSKPLTFDDAQALNYALGEELRIPTARQSSTYLTGPEAHGVLCYHVFSMTALLVLTKNLKRVFEVGNQPPDFQRAALLHNQNHTEEAGNSGATQQPPVATAAGHASNPGSTPKLEPNLQALVSVLGQYFSNRSIDPGKLQCFRQYLIVAARADLAKSTSSYIKLGIKDGKPIGALEIAAHCAGIDSWLMVGPDFMLRLYSDHLDLMSLNFPNQVLSPLWPGGPTIPQKP